MEIMSLQHRGTMLHILEKLFPTLTTWIMMDVIPPLTNMGLYVSLTPVRSRRGGEGESVQ